MPYIDNTDLASNYKVYATDLLGGLLNILVSHGWAVTKTFRKGLVGYTAATGTGSIVVDTVFVARHTILRSPQGKYIGFAEIDDQVSDQVLGNVKMLGGTGVTPAQWAQVNTRLKTEPFKNPSKIFYIYMVENEPTLPVDDTTLQVQFLYNGTNGLEFATSNVTTGLSPTLINNLLDVEYSATSSDHVILGTEPLVDIYQADIKQSPIVPVDYFRDLGEVDNTFNTSNLWGDTEFSVQGRVDGDGFFFTLQGDTAVNPTNNVIPNYPILYGAVIDNEGRHVSECLFAGTLPTSATFNYAASTSAPTGGFMPVAKSYPRYPSDGVNSVMVKRGRRGARYQAHYLSWGATPSAMPPDRANAGKQYPRAWTDEVKNYGLQPSRYSDKIQTSYIYVVHPEEGVIGRLKNLVGLQLLTTSNPELRILREACPVKVRDSYKVAQVSVISPLTKRPATPYPVMSVAIKKAIVERTPSTTPAPVTGLTKNTVDGLTTLTWDAVNDPFISHFNVYKESELVLSNVSDVNKVVVTGTGSFSIELVDFADKKSTRTSI